MIKKTQIKATTIRNVMGVAITMTIGLSILGFYLTQDMLKTLEIEVANVVSKSTLNKPSSSQTKTPQKDIDNYQAPYNKALTLTIPVQDYQATVTKDLNQYASTSDISITDFNFANTAAKTNTALQNNGISTRQVTIKLGNPVNFNGLMQFFKLIESSAPKLQVTNINFTSIPKSDNSITVEPLTIEFYTR